MAETKETLPKINLEEWSEGTERSDAKGYGAVIILELLSQRSEASRIIYFIGRLSNVL